MIDLIGGGHFEKGLSRGSNSFILSGSKFRNTRGWAQGNVAGTSHSSDHPDFKQVIREEILHNWQYRRGGLLNLSRLAIEHIFKKGDYPYYTPGTLEYEARTRSALPYSERPWELQCSGCDKFY